VPHISGLSDAEIKQLEVDNGFRQFDLATDVIETFLDRDRPFALHPSLLQQLQAVAVNGIEAHPGDWRSGTALITESDHSPPGPHLIGSLVQELCDYINDNWHEQTAFHLASYIMWRLNWIHPFSDGNGRTSRMLSYIVLCIKLGYLLPGSPTIPQQIEKNRDPYYNALKAADNALVQSGGFDFAEMEGMLKEMLANQLLNVIEMADGGKEAT